MREGASEGGSSKLGIIYDQITGDEDARVCKDIPERLATISQGIFLLT
jgi:hypothetical protein